VFPFVFDGRKIAQGRVAPGAIVEAFDELKDGYPRLAVRSEATPIDEFAFEGGEETLAHRIVVGVADRLSRMNASFLAAIAESDRRVLRTAVRMMDYVVGTPDVSEANHALRA
jgi:hypothetical protein